MCRWGMRSWRRNPPGNEKADNAGILERMAEVFGMNIKMADAAGYLGSIKIDMPEKQYMAIRMKKV